MLVIRPPEYSLDATPCWISPADPAWDHERIKTERIMLIDAVPPTEAVEGETEAEAEERRAGHEARCVEAGQTHPVSVWYTGASRFDEDALITVPVGIRRNAAGTVTIADYLTSEPARFEITHIEPRAFRTIRNALAKHATSLGADDPEEAANASTGYELALLLAVKHGLVSIETVDGKGQPVKLIPARDAAGAITDDWLAAIDRQDRTLLGKLGGAIFYGYNMTKWEAADVEGKP